MAYNHDEISEEAFVQACEELGYDPEVTMEGENPDVDSRAYEINFQNHVARAEAAWDESRGH